ncbi:hypothetical protein B0H14DRAFT_3425999 [Mycena olivaceomarginata]|nr:hypothetical protein B0H14DRAFT_3425999 [Mycena olivaceomarginata]
MITPTDEKTIPQPQSIEIPRSQADMTQPQVAIPQPSTAGTTRLPTDPKVQPNPPPYSNLASQIPSSESNGGNVTEAEWKNKSRRIGQRRATEFEKAPDADKKAMPDRYWTRVGDFIAAPFAIVGALFVGTGMLLKGEREFLD